MVCRTGRPAERA